MWLPKVDCLKFTIQIQKAVKILDGKTGAISVDVKEFLFTTSGGCPIGFVERMKMHVQTQCISTIKYKLPLICFIIIIIIDTDEIPGFFLLLKNNIFIARSEDTIFIFHLWGYWCRHGIFLFFIRILTFWNRKYKYYCRYFSFITLYPSFITFLWQVFCDRWPL